MQSELDFFLGLVLSGLTRGSKYALIALGYTMVYGVIGLINFAHGEIYMIGAYVGIDPEFNQVLYVRRVDGTGERILFNDGAALGPVW